MIEIKSKREIELMREAGNILDLTREMLKTHVKPGISTHQLDELADSFIRKMGATPSFKGHHGFPGSICASINEVVVHGIPSKKVILKEGDIISIDLGVKYKGYHADSAITLPVGDITDELKQLLDVTEKSLYVGLSKCAPGNHVSDIGAAIEEFIKPYGYGIVEDFTGHGIGKDLWQDPPIPNFGKPGEGPILKEGMTICVEPMINLGTKRVRILSDNWTTITQDKKPSAHFEHMVVITDTGYEILTLAKKE